MTAEQTASTGHIYSRNDFTWREYQDAWALHATGRRSAIVHIVPDATWRGMWCIRHREGRLSAMANLTWAKDGAIALAMRLLDPRRKAEQGTGGADARARNRGGRYLLTGRITPIPGAITHKSAPDTASLSEHGAQISEHNCDV
jgi:hypothetical protein